MEGGPEVETVALLHNDMHSCSGTKVLFGDSCNIHAGNPLNVTVSETINNGTRGEPSQTQSDAPQSSIVSRTTSDDSGDDPISRIETDRPYSFLHKVLKILFPLLFCLRFWVVFAAVYTSRDPCDAPLRWYVIITNILYMFLRISKLYGNECYTFLERWEHQFSLLLNSVGFLMLYLYRSCQKINPSLYVGVCCWIVVDVFAILLLLLYTKLLYYYYLRQYTDAYLAVYRRFYTRVYTNVITREFIRHFGQSGMSGCAEAVGRLQKVPGDSSELIDPEDGSILRCAICSDPLSAPKPVVRTFCLHFFHEECLVQWCSNHLDCPLCRRRIEGQ